MYFHLQRNQKSLDQNDVVYGAQDPQDMKTNVATLRRKKKSGGRTDSPIDQFLNEGIARTRSERLQNKDEGFQQQDSSVKDSSFSGPQPITKDSSDSIATGLSINIQRASNVGGTFAPSSPVVSDTLQSNTKGSKSRPVGIQRKAFDLENSTTETKLESETRTENLQTKSHDTLLPNSEGHRSVLSADVLRRHLAEPVSSLSTSNSAASGLISRKTKSDPTRTEKRKAVDDLTKEVKDKHNKKIPLHQRILHGTINQLWNHEKYSLETVEKEYRYLIRMGRIASFFGLADFKLAATLMEHWLDGGKVATQKDVEISYPKLLEDKTFSRIQGENVSLLLLELKNRLLGGVTSILKHEKTMTLKLKVSSPFTATSRALFYASGSSHLDSTGTFTLKWRAGGKIQISASISHYWRDRYDWHPGKWVNVPGYGLVPDAAAHRLTKAGRAKPFNMSAQRIYRYTGEFTGGKIRLQYVSYREAFKPNTRKVGEGCYFFCD